VPLASAGIACLGLVPVLGGPERPSHWAVTVGMVGFGGLLWARQRLTRREGALARVPARAARNAGRTVLLVCAVVSAIIAVVVLTRLREGGGIGLLSLAMPGAGLLWLTSLGLKTQRHRDPAADAAPANDRPSRRPPRRDALPKPKSGQGSPSSERASA
jgi:hypothetical protein